VTNIYRNLLVKIANLLLYRNQYESA